MAYQIYGEGVDATLNITVDGWYVFGCTLTPIAPESREWFAKHIDQAFQKASERAGQIAVAKHQDALLKLLGAPVPHRNR